MHFNGRLWEITGKKTHRNIVQMVYNIRKQYYWIFFFLMGKLQCFLYSLDPFVLYVDLDHNSSPVTSQFTETNMISYETFDMLPSSYNALPLCFSVDSGDSGEMTPPLGRYPEHCKPRER